MRIFIKMALRFIAFISIILIFDLFFRVMFFNILPESLRARALYITDEVHSGGKVLDYARIMPYLWSNYKPNPLSKDVNEYGWRYGGGPKKAKYRILCLGGSTTWSDSASLSAKSYPAQMEKILTGKGYDVDVVNGGCPYYTSAELLGTLLFRGIYEEPDMVLIHTGGNDIVPYCSPLEYKADYTHWRTVDRSFKKISYNDVFRVIWKIPSWTLRTFAAIILKPDPFSMRMLADQVTTASESALAENDISAREPVGLENNLRSLAAIARAHGAEVVFITPKINFDKVDMIFAKRNYKKDECRRAENRIRFAINRSIGSVIKISDEVGAALIPFHELDSISSEHWTDHCHLDNEGCGMKAGYIADWIENNYSLPLK